MDTAIVVCGRIGSGKSTVIEHIAKGADIRVVSFGDYVRHIARARNLEESREVWPCVKRPRRPSPFIW